jgi:hypothetical protein
MLLRHTKAAAAGLWMLGVLAFFVQVSQSSWLPEGIATAALAFLPPILLWFWWNDPAPTMSESIHEVRNGPGRGSPGSS